MKYTIRSIVCKASCHLVTWSLGHLVTRSLGHSVAWSLGHSVIRSLGYLVTHMITIFNMAIDELTDWLTNNIRTFRSALQTTRRHGPNVTRLWMPGYIGQADNDNSAELISVDSGWGIVFQQIFTFRSILSYFLDILWPQKIYFKNILNHMKLYKIFKKMIDYI